jgi:hypothetical protein
LEAFNSVGLFWAEIKCIERVALPKQPINQFLTSSAKQTTGAYCPDVYTVYLTVTRHRPLDITASNLCDIIAWKKEMGNFPEIRELPFGAELARKAVQSCVISITEFPFM